VAGPPEPGLAAITRGIRRLVAEAEAQIETWSVEQAMARLADEAVVFVDVRDVRELWREGTVPGAFHAPRGMLEFWVDPESPYAKDVFASGKRFVLFCAAGWRSALAAKAVQDMGLSPVCHIAGGFTAWREAGGPVEARAPKAPKPR
jgi:rhodanese-related sulfurtransferase